MTKFVFNPRTGMMDIKKDDQIYFAQSQGGGLRIDDHKHNVKFIVNRNETITNISGISGSNVGIYDMRDARIIAERVLRMFGNKHRYADYKMFLQGHKNNENIIKSFDEFVNEGIIGDMVRRDLVGNKRKEDTVEQIYFPKTKYDLKAIVKNEMKTQGDKHLNLRMVDVSDIEDMSYIFSRYKNLKSIDISNWNVSSVKNMAFMFSECENLKSIDVSNWDVHKVKYMNGMFFGCENLKSIDVSNWNVSGVKNMTSMFSDCKNLKSIDVSNWNVSGIENMARMFSECKNLESIDVSNWNVSGVKDMNCMFSGCKNLKSIDVSNWNVSSVENMNEMFYGCKFNYKLSNGKLIKI